MKGGGRPYTFDVNEMLKLRAMGWGFSELGRKYGKDHTTIMYHCQKFGVVAFEPPPLMPNIEWIVERETDNIFTRQQKGRSKYDYLLLEADGKINEGKSYKQYIEDAKKQKDGQWYRLYAGKPRRFTGLTKSDSEEGGKRHSVNLDLVQTEWADELRDRDQGIEEWQDNP